MSSRLKENFLRHAILVVDHSKDSLISLVALDLSSNGLSFEQFINKNQHEIYHLHNSSRCCQCPNGYNPPRSPRILHAQQMDLVFDRSSQKPCHKSGRSADYCCSTARPGLRTDILDLTMARCLLVNFCLDVFWYSCLNQQGKTLEDFLNNHKHDIYHLWQYNTPCCQCPASGYKFPSSRPILDQAHWIQMFNALKLPCLNHKKRPIPGSMHSICSVAAMTGITVTHLDPYLSKVILQNFCSLWQTVDTLVKIRNVDYGHASAGEMTDQEYNKSVNTIELNIMEIGRICNKETHFKGVIHEAKHGTLQYTLFEKYKDSLIETLARQDEFSKNLTEIVVPRLERLEGTIACKAKKIPTVIAEKIPKIIGESIEQFQETLGQKPTNQVFICQTDFEIQSHVKERTYVETNAVRKCIKNAEKYDVFVIYGSEGTGKTRTGLEILRQFVSKDQSYDLIKISSLEEVKQVITDKRKIVILLDDVFRTNYCSCESVKNNNILDLLHSRRSAGKLKLIFTIDSAIRRSVKELFNSHRLFHGRYQMDLTLLQFCMTDAEKEEVLTKFCEYKKIQIKLNKSEGFKDRILDRKTFYEISMTDPYMGYPKACFLFTSDKQNFLQGAHFFKHTSKSLINEINTLCYKTDDLVLYATLVHILLSDSCLTVDSIQVQKVTDIMQLCGSSQRFTRRCNIIHSLEKMDGKYLVYDAYDQSYKFKHQMVYEAVAISYFDVDPDTVIDVLTFEFISEMVRLQNINFKQKEEVVLIIPEDQYINLAKQLIRILHEDYQTKSFKFVEMLCETRVILEDNADFVNLLLKESETCIISDETDLSYLNNTVKVKFNFCSALLLYLTKKQNVDKSITVTLYFMEQLIKDGIDQNLVSSCKNTIISIFDYLCENEEVDTISAFIVQPLTEWGIDCNFNEYIYRSMDNEKNSTAGFLLKLLSQEINLVELVIDLEAEEMPRIAKIASETFKIPSSCIYTGLDRIELIKWFIRYTPYNTFNMDNMIKTSASENLVNLLTWCLLKTTNLSTVDVNGVIKCACENGWEEVLIILMNKNMFNPNDVVYMFNTAVGKSMTRLVILLLTRYPSFCDVQSAFTSALDMLEDDKFMTMKCLILNVKNPFDMKMIMNSILYQLDSCQIYPFYDWLLEEADKHIMKSVINNENLNILKWSLINFASHRKDLVERIYGTLNSKITNYVDILQWFVVNMEPSVLPIKYIMDMVVQKRLTKILIWILKNYDHERCDLLDHATIVCKSKDQNLIEIFFSNVDLRHMNLESVVQTMIATNLNSQYSAQILWILQLVDHKLLDMGTLINTACENEEKEIVKYLIENVDHTLFDINTAMNIAYEEGDYGKVRYLIENVDRTLFDKKAIMRLMNEACEEGDMEIVRCLIENFEHTLFDKKAITHLMNEAWEEGDYGKVRYLIENVDRALFDKEAIMHLINEACEEGDMEIVRCVIENCEHALTDEKAIIHILNTACQTNYMDIVKYLTENVEHTFFNMKTIIYPACRYGRLDIVKYWIENVDHTLFNMKTVISSACQNGSLEIVKYLMDMFNRAYVYMKTPVSINCEGANLSILQYFYEYRHCVTENIQELINTTFNCIDEFTDSDNSENIIMLFCETKNEHIDWSDVLSRACGVGFYSVVEWILNNLSHAILDLTTAILRALHFDEDDVAYDIIYLILQNSDHNLMDMKTVINAICHHGFTKLAMEALKDQKLSTFDLKTIMNEACLHSDLDLVKWLWESADDSLFDMKTAMLKVCRSKGYYSISVLKWLWENVNRDSFDMDVAIDNACAYGRTETVEWLWTNTNTEIFQIQKSLLKACEGDHVSSCKWLIMNVPEHLLDLPHALQTVCLSSKCSSADIVQVLVEHADKSKLDIDSLIGTACKYCKIDIVRYLINYTDIITIDFKSTLNSVLSIDINKVESNKSVNQGKQDLVLLILQKADPSNINIESAIVEACKHDWLDVMKHIWLNISHKCVEMNAGKIRLACEYGSVGIIQWSLGSISLECIDINTLMIESCGYGWLNIVKRVWNHEQISHDKLDMKTAMSDACTYNRFEIVTWLLKNTDDQTFDTSYVLIESCRNGWTDIVENIVQNGDSIFNNMTVTAGITEACANGHLPVIDFMYRTFGTELFDLETISEQRTKASENEDVTMFFLRNLNCNSFDISTVLKRACSFGWTRVVKWIINELEYDGDLAEPLNNACVNGEAEIVKYILQNISQEKLDLKSAMLCACNKGWDEIVALLIQKVDHQKLNVRSAVIEACRCEDSDCVFLIIRQVDHKFIDLNAVLIEICKNSAREQLVLSILKTVDGSEFDRNIVEETAKKNNWRKVLLYLNSKKS